MSMLRVASDATTIERRLEDLYPGGVELLEWERCLSCDREVDAYVYVAGIRRGYCYSHWPIDAQ